jgi:hypothetical protein
MMELLQAMREYRKRDQEQMLAEMKADREADKEERKADREADKEERKADQAKADAARKADKEEMLAAINANHKEMMAMIKAWGQTDTKNNGEETTACQETMEARLEVEEPASADITPEVADDQEVPVEDAVGMPAGDPRRRRRDGRNLAAVRRQK